jgi:MutS domain V
MGTMQDEAPEKPAAAYWARQQFRASEAARSHRLHIVIGYLRVLLALAIAATLWLALEKHLFSWRWVFVPFTVFVAIAWAHSRVLRQRSRARRAVGFYDVGLAHIEEQWGGLRPRKTRLDLSESLYASVLNLFDDDGLFELLCAARTPIGEDRLADWLLHPATAHEIRERQAAVRDLRERFDLREDLGIAGSDSRLNVDAAALLAWAEDAPRGGLPSWLRWFAPVLVLLTLASAVLSFRIGNFVPLIAMVLLDAILTYGFAEKVNAILNGARKASDLLKLFAELIARLEGETFTAELLVTLQGRFTSDGRRASAVIGSLGLLAELADYRLNYIVRILDAPCLYSLQVAGRVQRWRQAHGRACRAWLNALGQMEALLSLATYSYEHPDDPFPEIVEGNPAFEAAAMGHPLMPVADCVRNDVELNSETWLLLVSGSNMSGKSTLLRAVGMNTVLAMAGAPVRAASLRITPVRVGANIGISDSFVEGRSRFYAEILRLGSICELAETAPVLFLLDELLGGTNSVDRLAGAEGVASTLLRNGAIGLISTHDLALAEIGDREGWHVSQWHFDEQIVEDGMRFDYLLKPGPVTTRNGVALMRLIGLKV